ncbi:sterile alpha motif domain-containing protein 9-like [Saccostrea echinata]|uniref:sterile alpha motif domain-containing protein 9-like n=1 Tax=Saccostrea echinata TaxID=191078 RepID=UPI002A7F7213|nr:sterile alpha motif domain-containing protein 9-like [Saccostrea echinata]
MTLYVSGIPKMTCKSSDVEKLFSSVAQLKRVEFNTEKGCAKLSLFDKNTTQFVIEKTWKINGAELFIKELPGFNKKYFDWKSEMSHAKTKRSENTEHTKPGTDMPYQAYKRKASSFWKDIPHQEAKIRKKIPRGKFHLSKLKIKCLKNNSVLSIKGSNKHPKKKQRKLSKDVSEKNLDKYSSITLEKFIGYLDKVKREVFSTGPEIHTRVQDMEHSGENECHIRSVGSREESKRTSSHLTEEKCNDIAHSQRIPVCLLYREKNTVVKFDSHSNSLFELKEKIRSEFGIPSKLQLMLYKGKIVNQLSSIHFEPFDNIYVLVKGKGGMQESSTDIATDSSETDVEQWLKDEVGLNDGLLNEFSILSVLDGQTLFSYDISCIDSFLTDTELPVGLARKILGFRDKIYEGISNPLLNYSSLQISEFIKGIFPLNESIDQLCQCAVDRHVDGYVFYSYKDEKQIQHDFQDLNLKGLYFKKIFLKRNEKFKIGQDPIKTPEFTTFLSENVATGSSFPFKPIQEEHGGEVVDYPVQEAFSENSFDNDYEYALCRLLQLNKLQRDDCEPCQLSILHGGWTNMNELEKNFVFFIISCEDECREKQQQYGLWKQIGKHMGLWLDHLPPRTRDMFTESRQSGVYLYNRKKSVQLSNQCKLAFVMDKDLATVLKFEVAILLISKTLLQIPCVGGYVTSLSRNPKKPEHFKFSFNSLKEYYIFNPEDYSEGFCKEVIPATYYMTVHERNIKGKEKQIETQIPRDFKKSSDYVVYSAGKIFSQPENDGTLSTRCLEFKSFFNCVNKAKENRLIKFQLEVLRFACGCLNARKNGTIYFGVADSVASTDNETHKHGEIVGFEISEIDLDSRTKYTDALRDGISRCFFSEMVTIVQKCISNPIFVKVVIPGENICRYVMEVDVEPSYGRCKEHHFKVNLKNIKNLSNKSVENKPLLYVRKGSSTTHLTNEREELFIKAELLENVKERQLCDNERKTELSPKREELATKLERLLTRGTFRFDKRLWPVLVLSKPTDQQKLNEKWTESMSFIKRMQFTAVFDFDDFSNKNGLCHLYRNTERSYLQTERLFHDNAGNFQELANKLGLPYDVKTVWIFANGRNDYFEDKPHLNRSGWHVSYSAGVCDAVSFFNQNFVIPKGRAVILILLFSSDYFGLIDTFNEITRNFGWEPVVIIAEHQRVFDDFAETIQQECKGDREQLENVSVVGMPWEHVKSTITSLTGYDEKMNCFLPSSSGALVHVDERFIDALDDLSILSANQCESKEFKNSKVRKQFAGEQELQFYKGKHVTWWNFFFENHVCERYKFLTLQERAQSLLLFAKEETRKIVTLTIAHEPGAGATTLGHQLLWNFRRKYRCCVIQKISEMTTSHILSLWQYKECDENESQPGPVILLLDDIVQTELSITEFTRQLNIEFRKKTLSEGMDCLLIMCQREEKISYGEYQSQNIFYLKQELSKSEKTWFTDKFDELERTGKELELEEYKPQHLISFMIMRSEFNPEYIKTTIQHLICDIDPTSNEYKLMKYVSFLASYSSFTRRGVKVFIPLECCDELMGSKHGFWEDRLSSPLRVLLIIEEKENASGRQVRIAHPSLGKVLLKEIMKREETQLTDIAEEYLNCSLLQSNSYGKKLLVDFTLDMLKRRKKEEYDDEKTTQFSPLIEDIISGSVDNYGKAAEILQLGFYKFKDYMLPQALARLYLKWQKYDEAIKWAKEAVDLSSKQSLSYILHTYGLALREKFKHLTKQKFFQPKDACEHLDLILNSLEVFLRAQRERDDETDTQKLLNPFHDAIHTINEITKFLTMNINCTMDRKDMVHYLKNTEFIPDEISIVWQSFHQRLKQMREQGHNAFKVLEDNVCFNTTFYAPEEAFRNTTKLKEHRFYRSFHYGHERMLERFSQIYGESDPHNQVEGVNQASRDAYHRGRLWTLKGNSYMNIFSHMKNSGNKLGPKQIQENLNKIKEHVMAIESKDSNDLANQVCVNVALGIMGSPNRDSEKDILKTCQKIISAGSERVDLAYLFISMLLWPCDNPKSFYDDSLLQKSLSYLKRNYKQEKYKPNVQKFSHFIKEERNISQPTPQFFLAKGKGLRSLCHRWEMPVFVRENPDSQFDNSLWDHYKTKEKLRRLHGTTTFSSDGSSPYIVFENKHGEPIRISKIRGTNKGFVSEEKVLFYLGFSIAGPIAYNVKPARYEKQLPETFSRIELFSSSKIEDYMKKTTDELRKILLKIKGLEEKRPEYLKEREKQLMKDKDDVKEALDRLEINNGETDLSLLAE